MSGIQPIILIALTVFAALVSSAAIRIILHTRLVNLFADTPDHRKVHSAPIPRVGGIAIILSMIAASLAWHVFSAWGEFTSFPYNIMLSVFAAAVGIGGLGFLDDSKFFNVLVSHKLVVVIGLAVLTVYVFGVSPGEISVFGWFTVPESVGKVIAVLWIVGLINAYNLVDGLDGFAGTISIISLVGISAAAILSDCSAVAVLSFFAVGATVGFMTHNAPPAKVFMGDTGSCFLGFIISMMTIHMAGLMGAGGKVPLVMPLIAGLPILEVLVTIARRYFKANEDGHPIRQILKYIVTADSSHIHHRFLFRGFSHLETCVLVGTLAATIVGSAICVVLAPLSYAPWIVMYLIPPVGILLYKLGFGGRFKRALKISDSRYNSFHKPNLIGVIEADGMLFDYLSRRRVKGFAFVPLVSNKDLPIVAAGLKGAIVRGGSDLPEMTVGIVKELSSAYGFAPMQYTGERGKFNIIANRKAVMSDTAPMERALCKFAEINPC